MLTVLRGADLRIVNCECAPRGRRKARLEERAVFKRAAGSRFRPDDRPVRGRLSCQQPRLRLRSAGFPGDARRPAPERHQDRRRRAHSRGSFVAAIGHGQGDKSDHPQLLVRGRPDGLPRRGRESAAGRSTSSPPASGGPRSGATSSLVVAHAGLEYIPFPPPYVVSAYRVLSDGRSGCVVGHHPHVPQGLELRDGRAHRL